MKLCQRTARISKRISKSIGHVRYATRDSSALSNVQPFLFKSHIGDLGLAHNGNIVNALHIRRALEDEGAIFQTTSDSEVFAHLLRRAKGKDRKARIKKVLQQLKGAFAFMIMSENSLTIALDDHGVRPLMLGKKDDAYCVASETCAFQAIGADYIRDIEPGELITITDDGIDFDKYTDYENLIFALWNIFILQEQILNLEEILLIGLEKLWEKN